MEAKDYLTNAVGDVLSPIKNNTEVALFQVIDSANSKFKDIYFVAKVEPKTDIYGTKLHLPGGGEWEKNGQYFESKKNALELFEKLNSKDTNEQYYQSKISK